jgi:hypothetical protein
MFLVGFEAIVQALEQSKVVECTATVIDTPKYYFYKIF